MIFMLDVEPDLIRTGAHWILIDANRELGGPGHAGTS